MDRNMLKAYRAIQEVAGREGVSVEQVFRSIEEVISQSYSEALEKKDLSRLDAWHEIPCKGQLPTPLELVAYLGERAAGESGMMDAEGNMLS